LRGIHHRRWRVLQHAVPRAVNDMDAIQFVFARHGSGEFVKSGQNCAVVAGGHRRPSHHNPEAGGALQAASFSGDGKTLLTIFYFYEPNRSKARLWRVDSGAPLTPPLEHKSNSKVLAVSPDGKVVLMDCGDHGACLWRVDTGSLLTRPSMHQEWVMAGAFSPDGKTVLTGREDNTARLWRVELGSHSRRR
jgi:WD40 repeat protein